MLHLNIGSDNKALMRLALFEHEELILMHHHTKLGVVSRDIVNAIPNWDIHPCMLVKYSNIRLDQGMALFLHELVFNNLIFKDITLETSREHRAWLMEKLCKEKLYPLPGKRLRATWGENDNADLGAIRIGVNDGIDIIMGAMFKTSARVEGAGAYLSTYASTVTNFPVTRTFVSQHLRLEVKLYIVHATVRYKVLDIKRADITLKDIPLCKNEE